MPQPDQQRWNARYSQDRRFSFEKPRPFLVENASLLPTSGLALDIAMGLGGNAEFLLAHGLRVIGVDISEIALQRARQRLPGLLAVQADLTHFNIPANSFDVILNFYYLERSLWTIYPRALKPGGLLLFESLTVEMQQVQTDIDPAYLLQPGELLHAFPTLDVLVYREGWSDEAGHRRPLASLVARAPALDIA